MFLEKKVLQSFPGPELPQIPVLITGQGADLVQGTPALWRSLVSAGWKGHEGEVPKGRCRKGYYGTEV